MEEDAGEEEQLVYIDSSVQDNKGLISLYLAAMAKEKAEAELRPPGFHLPNLVFTLPTRFSPSQPGRP